MAEAAVEERPAGTPKFFCHKCNVELSSVSPEYTCPHCSGGFIEELLPAEREGAVSPISPFDFDLNARLSDEISSLLMSVTGVQHMEPDDNSPSTVSTDGPTNSRGRPRRRNRIIHNLHNFDNVLQDFLLSIPNTSGQPGMFYMSNPADYVYGRVGLDSIVTQLLNQMDSTGPPPLAKDKIAEIPKVGVTAEQVEAKLQCSICWEDFQISETVRQLPCVHIYHENCIIPWLELHGTCPVCRQTLSNDTVEDQQQAAVADAVADATNTLHSGIATTRITGTVSPSRWRNYNRLRSRLHDRSIASTRIQGPVLHFTTRRNSGRSRSRHGNVAAMYRTSDSSSGNTNTTSTSTSTNEADPYRGIRLRQRRQPARDRSSSDRSSRRRDDEGNVDYQLD